MKRYAVLLGTILLLLTIPVHAETCEISTGHGLLKDLDCDKVPDKYDNCNTYNPQQIDFNNNGIGDACEQHRRQRNRKVEHDNKQPRTTDQTTKPQLTVEALQNQDFDANGPGAVYPITITNNGNTPTKVTVYLKNHTGTYTINPAPQQTIQPGQQTTFYTHVTNPNPGTYTSTAVIKANDHKRTLQLTQHIHGKQPTTPWGWILITGALLLIIIGTILLTLQNQQPPENEDEEIYSYY